MSNPEASERVLARQRQFWAALQAKDAKSMRDVIAPDFVACSPGEPDQTREIFIQTLATFPWTVQEVTPEQIAVHAFGEVAVLTGVQHATVALPDGRQMRSRVMLTNVYRLLDGDWRMVLSNAVELRDTQR